MVVCNICKNEYKRIDIGHIKYKHGISNSEYLIKFPGAKLCSDESRIANSIASKNYFNSLSEDDKKVYGKYERTAEFRKKSSIRFKKLHEQGAFKNAYNEVRNKKISEVQKKRWENISKEDRSVFWKTNIKKIRDTIGEDAYRKRMGIIGIKSFSDKNIKHSKLETRIFDKFKKSGLQCIDQFEIDGYYYDIYLPKYNILIEIDGEFWHPKSLAECEYPFQKTNYFKDIRKNEICEKLNIKLIRIRESEEFDIDNIILNIINEKY